MKKMIALAVLSIFLAGGLFATFIPASAAARDNHLETALAEIPKASLSEAEKKGLLLMREEEKLARDLYLSLYDKWGTRAFSNIAKSEQHHMDSIKILLDRYGLADPVSSDRRGKFSDPTLQKAYDDLLKQGLTSRAEAAKVGAIVEEMDIKDLREAIALTDNKDLKLVYANLEKGSRNHLRAFGKQLSKENVRYTATYLDQADAEKIMKSPQERDEITDI